MRASEPPSAGPLLSVAELRKHFPVRVGLFGRRTEWVRAVDGVTLDVARGETLGIVGESGCGKSTLGRVMLRMLDPTAGTVTFDGEDITKVSGEALRKLRRHMQIVFQDPVGSLDPRQTVGEIVGEGLDIHAIARGEEKRARIASLLDQVGLQPEVASRYPHEFSGGQRQRIGIARALAVEPDLVVADEPVSALDVSIQAQIINLLQDLQEQRGLTYVFIAHDLRVVEHISRRVAIMYLGKIVELADSATLYEAPRHPYTRALLSAIPSVEVMARRERIVLRGDVPSPIAPPSGCAFHPRCAFAEPRCRVDEPALGGAPGHRVACHVFPG
jgi:peptide/nickel transport system ATP-binding protein